MAGSPASLVDEHDHEQHDAPSADPPQVGASSAVVPAPREPHLRTQFLRRVAHDIASPAGVALTVLDELAHGGETRPELVGMARRSLRRLMRLSEQLALVAELEAGQMMPERAQVDLRTLVKKALDDALAIDGRRDVLAGLSAPEAAVPALVDARLLGGVLREIFGNALRAASGRVEVTLRGGAETALLSIDDDGPGFSAEALEILGRRFVPRPAARGLGLSLSVAIDVLRAHDATLEVVESELPPGRRGVPGAGVRITLPLAAR